MQTASNTEVKNPWLGLNPTEAAARLISTVKVFMRGRIGDAELRILRERVESGVWNAAEISARVAKAAASLDLEGFAQNLEQELNDTTPPFQNHVGVSSK